MNFKKILAGVSAASIAVSMLATATTSAFTAGGDIVDFEDGDCSFVVMNMDAGADKSKLSVVSFQGSKQLKVDVQDCTTVPKIWFRVADLVDNENWNSISKITFDITCESLTETQVGWVGGAVGSAGGYGSQEAQVNPDWAQSDFSFSPKDNEPITKWTVEKKFLLPATKYKADSKDPFFGVMAFMSEQADYDLYIDNIKFLDSKGKVIPLKAAAAAPETEAATEAAAKEEEVTTTTAAATEAATEAAAKADETAATAETTAAATEAATEAAAAETEAPAATEAPAVTEAPAATPAPATGNPVSAGAIAGVMMAAAALAVVAKKRK